MKIPSDNKWTQTNNGNIFGILHETHNCSFHKKGQLTLSQRALGLIDSQTTDFSDIMAIVHFDGDYFIVTDDKVFSGDLSTNAFAVVGSSPELGTVSDAVAVYDRLYVSDTTALAYINTSGSWTTGIGSLTATFPHPLCVFDSLTTYKLAVGDGYQVKTYDSSGNANSTVLSLPQNYLATTMVYRNGYLYIGTKEVNGGEAAIFAWNGDGTSAQYKIDVGAAWVYSMTPYRSSIAAVTNEGELLLVSGSSVQQLGVFPVFHANAQWEANNATRGHVYNRGMVAEGDRIYINVDGDVEIGEVPEMKSGIWCYEPGVGLYHYASNTTDLYVTDDFEISDSVITTSAAHNLVVGDAIQFEDLTGLTGIEDSVIYYAIPVTTTTLKVAGTRQDAFDGDNITITGTKTDGDIIYCPNTNFGHRTGRESGAIAITNYLESPYEFLGSSLIWGTALYNEASVERSVLCILSDRYNEGWFSLQRVYTGNISDVWKKVTAFLEGITGSVEKMIVKARSSTRRSMPTAIISGSWVSANQINTSDRRIRNTIAVGDEMVFTRGYGQGRLAHITAIDTSSTVLSITIDEDYGTAAGTSEFYVTDYQKIQIITSDRADDRIGEASLDSQKSPFIDIKVELRGFNTSVSMLDLTHSVDKTAR